MVTDHRDKYVKHYLNIENNLFLMFSSCRSSDLYQHCLVSNIVIEGGVISNKISEYTYNLPLYVNKEESNLLI